jgi:hypothetical protein
VQYNLPFKKQRGACPEILNRSAIYTKKGNIEFILRAMIGVIQP